MYFKLSGRGDMRPNAYVHAAASGFGDQPGGLVYPPPGARAQKIVIEKG